MPGRATPFGLPAVVPKAQDVWPGYLNDASLVSPPPADSQAPGVNPSRPGRCVNETTFAGQQPGDQAQAV
jgi:hypothetical protein